MSNHSAGKIKIAGYNDLFGESMENNEKIIEVPLTDLYSFKNHPFHIINDFDMSKMIQSIKECGILVPGIVRKRIEGGYEIVSGHRRKYACEMIGIDTMPVIVKDLADDEATIAMVDANIQREHLLYSEKAFAYKLKFEAMKHQGSKGDKSTTEKIGKVMCGLIISSFYLIKINYNKKCCERRCRRESNLHRACGWRNCFIRGC
ncbi:MAG: ParB/RepB/Spo0J family partition protein [Anaerocolumna sp.]